MSFAQVFTRSVVGLAAPSVMVEVHLSQGLPALTIVGLPEATVRESKDRVRSAIINAGYQFPNRRLTINLAPADLPKEGARLDLPIAIGILAASGQIDATCLNAYEFSGELALNGDLRAITGALPITQAVKAELRTLIIPSANAAEASKVANVTILKANNLKAVCQHLQGEQQLTPVPYQAPDNVCHYPLDLADVKGQHQARRALEIAAAGGHSLLFCGPPGTGKTLMASRLPSILPPLNDAQALEVASIYSIVNHPYQYGTRPFRQVHHTASAVALVGGGSSPKPGEITLAHHGILFLDEIPEFDRKVLEVLRQPLENKHIVISRANAQTSFPADFQLIAAMNPCPCGYYGDSSGRCRCRPEQIKRYQDKLSGPLLDRIDLYIQVPAITVSDLQAQQPSESSASVRERVIQAYQRQQQRQGKCNQALTPNELQHRAPLSTSATAVMTMAQQRLNLSARGYHRVLRVARTIADLAHSENIETAHLTEALSYRSQLTV